MIDPQTQRRLGTLLSRHFDDGLDAAERDELRTLLESSAAARRFYCEFLAMEGQLAAGQAPAGLPENLPLRRSSAARGWGLAAAAAVLLLVGSLGLWSLLPMTLSSAPAPEMAAEIPEVGVVSELAGRLRSARGEPIDPEAPLREATYVLESGRLRLDFYAGASVELEGPGRFTVVSPTHLNVQEGDLAVAVYDARSLFKITSARSAFVDLGTEFAISVEEDGASELHVFEGSVLASTLGSQGSSERIHLVEKDESLRVLGAGGAREFEEGVTASPLSLRVHPATGERLRLDPAYTALVMASRPTAYWNFDDASRGPVVDVVPGGDALEYIGNAITFPREEGNTIARFAASEEFSALLLENPLEFARNQSFSVEFWVRPDRINRATLLALYDPRGISPQGETDHLALIDLMHRPIAFHHVPAAIRTAIRPVPSDDYYAGINMFTGRRYVPGRWVHVAFVKGPDYAATYLDGVESERIEIGTDDHTEAGRYAVILGQMSLQDWSTTIKSQKRPFVGALDEVAIYLHALSPDEIAARVRAAERSFQTTAYTATAR